ncbi:MAG: sigma-54-dependent Fis family transcriptional regulator [Spirochaetes bacterium]|nr:sigma-54-dependent Fis family transcriptional regulator [Spirochaetota bacterium]
MEQRFSVFVVEDERKMRDILRINLDPRYEVKFYENAEEALEEYYKKTPDLIVTDVRLPGIDGIELMERIKAVDKKTPFIVFTGYGSINHAVETIRKGAFDYLEKPIKIESLIQSIERVRSYVAVFRSTAKPPTQYGINVDGEQMEIVTRDPATRQMLNLAQKASMFDSPILIIGETGTGKELCARYIHESSGRRGPFVELNCASIPRNLLEGELFGYKKGSFTGALSDYEGKIGLSHGGTLFLDEIAELPLELQSKLLNVLEIPEYYPIGSNKKRKINLHIITATNKNLRKIADTGEFRSDLYYRIAVIPIKLPPLRERKCDVLPLVDYFIGKKDKKYVVTPDAKLRLMSYSWPGNVRELRNVLERSMLFAETDNIVHDVIFDTDSYSSFENGMYTAVDEAPERWEDFKRFKSTALKARKEELERIFVERLLVKNGGNISACARVSGMDRRQFQELIKALGIDTTIFRGGREQANT